MVSGWVLQSYPLVLTRWLRVCEDVQFYIFDLVLSNCSKDVVAVDTFNPAHSLSVLPPPRASASLDVIAFDKTLSGMLSRETSTVQRGWIFCRADRVPACDPCRWPLRLYRHVISNGPQSIMTDKDAPGYGWPDMLFYHCRSITPADAFLAKSEYWRRSVDRDQRWSRGSSVYHPKDQKFESQVCRSLVIVRLVTIPDLVWPYIVPYHSKFQNQVFWV